VADGGPVRRCLVIDLERVTVRQPVGDDGFEGTRVALFTFPARIAELQRGAGEGTSGPHRLVEAARPAVQMVFSVVPLQRAGAVLAGADRRLLDPGCRPGLRQRIPFSVSGVNPPMVFGVTTPAPVFVLNPANPYFLDSTHCTTGRKPCR